MKATSIVVNAFRPSSRRISPMYARERVAVEPTTSTGGGDGLGRERPRQRRRPAVPGEVLDACRGRP